MSSPTSLRPLQGQIVDGENNPVRFEQAYSINNKDLVHFIDAVTKTHGSGVSLLPLSATSGGGGIFQRNAPLNNNIVGLQYTPTSKPIVSLSSTHNIADTSSNQIVINQQDKWVCAGAAITLDQLNLALAETVGRQYKVLGADLTSYSYAQVGATFMTGGMGPQRRYFSDSVIEVTLFDGADLKAISGKDLEKYAGTYGWTGIVSAVKCQFHELPANEIAFALPVNTTPGNLGKLLQHFAPYCFLDTSGPSVKNCLKNPEIILGVEHITTSAMGPMFAQGNDNEITRRGRQLEAKCKAADADGLVFVNGYVDDSVEEFLLRLVDDPNIDTPTIAGINLEHTEVFNDPELMRAVREAVPFAARTQAPAGEFVYKGHTDATIRLNIDKVESAMQRLWQSNESYVGSVSDYFDSQSKINGQILIYGHLNPYGVDPHNRVTFASDNKQAFEQAVKFIHQQRDRFLVELQDLCTNSGSDFVGGEKGAGSEHEMFNAFGGPDQAPAALKKKFQKQREAIQCASPLFNWRALPPYITR